MVTSGKQSNLSVGLAASCHVTCFSLPDNKVCETFKMVAKHVQQVDIFFLSKLLGQMFSLAIKTLIIVVPISLTIQAQRHLTSHCFKINRAAVKVTHMFKYNNNSAGECS